MKDLDEEDYYLVHGSLTNSDSDIAFIYHERMPQDTLGEIWNVKAEDVDADFAQNENRLPSVDVNASRVNENIKIIIQWTMIFLCMWSSFCTLSDNALDILLAFLQAVFESMGSLFPVLAGFAVLFPKSLHSLRKQLGMDQDKLIKYVVCPKCHSLYVFGDCYDTFRGKRVSKKCSFVQCPHHRQHFRRTKCNEPLLKEVSLKSGETKLYPIKVYCYNSVINSLCHFLQRPGFALKCEMWRGGDIPKGYLADIFDGKIWKDWQYVNEQPYLASPRNFAFMLNVDWFQPFKHSVYSVGALYMVLMNLPRAERLNSSQKM